MNIKSQFRTSGFRCIMLVAAAVLVLIDQLIKYFVVKHLAPVGSVPIWDGVLRLTYVKNEGAAFGIFAGRTALLVTFTCVWILVLIVLLFSKLVDSKLLMVCISLIVGGGIGNLIDRIVQQYVVDYIHVELFHFAVFNFADCCVVIGTILFLIYFLFLDQKESKSATRTEEDNV